MPLPQAAIPFEVPMATSDAAAPLLERVCGSGVLPVLSDSELQIIRAVEDPDVTVAAVADLVSADPALTARVIRAARSALYGGVPGVERVTTAVRILGLRTLRTLTIGSALLTVAPGSPADTALGARCRRRGILCAAAGQALAEVADGCDAGSLLLIGLLMDTGMSALEAVIGPPYATLLATTPRHPALHELERQDLGACHAQASAAIGRRHWMLPEYLARAIEFHHRAQELESIGGGGEEDGGGDPRAAALAGLASIAGRCADVVMDDDPLDALGDLRAECAARLDLSGPACDRLLDRTLTTARELEALFEVQPPRPPAAVAAPVPAASPTSSSPPVPANPAQPIERRGAVRIPRRGTLRLFPYTGGAVHSPLRAECRDMSVMGIGLVAPTAMRVGTQFVMGLRRGAGQSLVVLYTVRQCRPLDDGTFRIGARVVRTVREQDLEDPDERETALGRFAQTLAAESRTKAAPPDEAQPSAFPAES
jgi:HD-like signal output (HDOD) protein